MPGIDTAVAKQLPTDQEIKEGFDLLYLTPSRQAPQTIPNGFFPPFERCSLLKDIRTTTAAHTGV